MGNFHQQINSSLRILLDPITPFRTNTKKAN